MICEHAYFLEKHYYEPLSSRLYEFLKCKKCGEVSIGWTSADSEVSMIPKRVEDD